MMRSHLEEDLPAEMRFLRSFAESGKTKIVVTGMFYEYGVVNGYLSENMPTNPVTTYGVVKDTLRWYLAFLVGKYGFSWNWVRLFFLYGKGQNPKTLLPQLDAAIDRGDIEFPMSGDEPSRDYLPVKTVANYICRIALQSDVSGVMNCCLGEYVTVWGLVETWVALRGSGILLKTGVYGYPVYMREWLSGGMWQSWMR